MEHGLRTLLRMVSLGCVLSLCQRCRRAVCSLCYPAVSLRCTLLAQPRISLCIPNEFCFVYSETYSKSVFSPDVCYSEVYSPCSLLACPPRMFPAPLPRNVHCNHAVPYRCTVTPHPAPDIRVTILLLLPAVDDLFFFLNSNAFLAVYSERYSKSCFPTPLLLCSSDLFSASLAC
jgi:hypothetical protein